MKQVLKWKPIGKILLDRPKQKWMNKVKKNLMEIRIQDEEALAQDKDRWKQACVMPQWLLKIEKEDYNMDYK